MKVELDESGIKKCRNKKKHLANYRLLKLYINLLSPEVQKLFFNVEEIVYIPKKRRFNWDGSAEFPAFGLPFICVYAPAFRRHPKRKKKNYVWYVLMHELAHTLDFTRQSLTEVPDEIHEGITEEEWQAILKTEPLSPEDFPSCSRAFRRYSHKPCEQWAIRMALTIFSDYLVPAGLIPENNISRTPKILSAAEFKTQWPKSHEFFHRYIKKILARA